MPITGTYRKRFKITNKKHGEPENINMDNVINTVKNSHVTGVEKSISHYNVLRYAQKKNKLFHKMPFSKSIL